MDNDDGDLWGLFGDEPTPPATVAAPNDFFPVDFFGPDLFVDRIVPLAAAPPPAPVQRRDEDEGVIDEDAQSASDGSGSDDNGSNQGDRDEQSNELALEYTPANLAKIFTTTESEFDFLFGPRPEDHNDGNASESAPVRSSCGPLRSN